MHDVPRSTEFGLAGSWLADYTLTALDAGMLVFDANGRASQWNARAAELLGVAEERLAGRALSDANLRLVDDGEQPFNAASDPARTVLRTGEPLSCRVGVPQAERGFEWRTLTLLPVYGPDRRPRAVLASVTSGVATTGPTGVEWQLTARSLLKSGIAAAMVVDRTGTIIEWNDRLLELTSRGEVELLQAQLEDLCDVDADWVWDQLRGREGEWVQGTTWALRPDGSETAVIGRFARAEWPGVGDVVIVQLVDPEDLVPRDGDVHDALGSQVFAKADVPMFLVTEHGIVADANQSALELLGESKLTLLGHPFATHLVGLEDDELGRCAIAARRTTDKVPVGTFVVKDRDGRDPVVSASITSMALPDSPSPYLLVQLVPPNRTAPALGRGPGTTGLGDTSWLQ